MGGLAPSPGFKRPDSNLAEFVQVADSSTLLGGGDLSSFIPNSKYSTLAGSLGGSFPMPPISAFFPRTAESNPLHITQKFAGEILDLQSPFEASHNPTIKLDLSLVPFLTLNTPQHPPLWRVPWDPEESALELGEDGHGQDFV